MTPFLLFSYALAAAGGLLLIGLAVVFLFAAVCWLLGARAASRPASANPPETATTISSHPGISSHAGVGLTGHREP